MPLTREEKADQIEQITEKLHDSQFTVLVNYHGLGVEATQQLRNDLLDSNCQIMVVKNTLAKLALEQAEGLDTVDTSLFAGPVALVYGFEDKVMPAKVLAEFKEDHPQLAMLGAFDASGEMYTIQQLEALAKLPSKQVLQGQLVGTIAAPLSGFANVLSGNLRGLVGVLNNYQKQQAEAQG